MSSWAHFRIERICRVHLYLASHPHLPAGLLCCPICKSDFAVQSDTPVSGPYRLSGHVHPTPCGLTCPERHVVTRFPIQHGKQPYLPPTKPGSRSSSHCSLQCCWLNMKRHIARLCGHAAQQQEVIRVRACRPCTADLQRIARALSVSWLVWHEPFETSFVVQHTVVVSTTKEMHSEGSQHSHAQASLVCWCCCKPQDERGRLK